MKVANRAQAIALSIVVALGSLLPTAAMAQEQQPPLRGAVTVVTQTLRNLVDNKGGRLGAGQTDVMVEAHGECRWLDNHSTGNEYFVPLATPVEWQSFIDFAPSAVTRAKCCPARTVALQASDGSTKSFFLDVGREGASDSRGHQDLSHQFSFIRLLDGANIIEDVTETYVCQDGTWMGQGSTVAAEVIPAEPEEPEVVVADPRTVLPADTDITFDCVRNAGYQHRIVIRDQADNALFDYYFYKKNMRVEQTLNFPSAAYKIEGYYAPVYDQRGGGKALGDSKKVCTGGRESNCWRVNGRGWRTLPISSTVASGKTCIRQRWDTEDGKDGSWNDVVCTVSWCE